MKNYLSLIFLLLLTGCTFSAEDISELPKDWFKYSNTLLNYSIDIPARIFIPNKDPNRDQVGFGNIRYTGIGKVSSGSELNIILFGRNPVACTPFALGVSDLQEREVEGTKVWTGRVDAFDSWGYATYEVDYEDPPPCMPPVESYRPLPGGDWAERIDGTQAYALCSEKDGKRVVVCVQQMTDNPKLAEEIFSTFRWTE
jgi:hypothetical protein